MLILKQHDSAGSESRMGLFISIGLHLVILAFYFQNQVYLPQYFGERVTEVEYVEKSVKAEESKGNPVKLMTALHDAPDVKAEGGNDNLVKAPILVDDIHPGTGNIQLNEPEGGGSGNTPLPSVTGENKISVEGLETSGRGLGNSEFTGGNGNASGTGKGVFVATGYDGYGTGLAGLPKLPFIPRQILEVVPEKDDDRIEGEIDLVLRIGVDGFVKEHKINKNTTGSSICLSRVITAAYKSRWEAVTFKGGRVEYWIEKKYRFN
ncbi:MAG: hypothetical protein ACM3S2_06010 [Ignavibacteriales bacterium]